MWYAIDDEMKLMRSKLFDDGLAAFQELWMPYFRKIIIKLCPTMDYIEEIMIKLFEKCLVILKYMLSFKSLHVLMNLDHMDMTQVVVFINEPGAYGYGKMLLC